MAAFWFFTRGLRWWVAAKWSFPIIERSVEGFKWWASRDEGVGFIADLFVVGAESAAVVTGKFVVS